METRITPAWAGKSISQTSTMKAAEDHPRMGGEKLPSWRDIRGCWGSPPHGRGKVYASSKTGYFGGITPAWAGKRDVGWPLRDINKDHPRMGGEKIPFLLTLLVNVGSPPHGRGKGFYKPTVLDPQRITPAWAGKRCVFYWRLFLHCGSPPHGRGKVLFHGSGRTNQRITPAWAGKSSALLQNGPPHGDHPRMGGEKFPISSTAVHI